MSGEWLKSSISELIQAYKLQENIYNQKHHLYYNKKARFNSMKKILDAVKCNRPETTLNEITKKIQTLRTQFGQEVSKIEKSKSLGDDLVYKPKIWWFTHLEWIGDFMKTRSDPTPLSAKTKIRNTEKLDETSDLFEFSDAIDDSAAYSVEFGEAEMRDESEPSPKKPKTYQSTKIKGIKPENPVYIASLLTEITDDKTFFELQGNITNSIFEASKNQKLIRKSSNS
ncbi:CLUMA_CG012975, isoform A [Clunio marinus]|uniref:CLUMA_CG012975, isoform A n=1 Tax=Clunio marinus TaxID=568069 RepID=A0A1J1IHG3_9DIPT|nr:CLUMA_CG012975, isoform A [Clunio marinus]